MRHPPLREPRAYIFEHQAEAHIYGLEHFHLISRKNARIRVRQKSAIDGHLAGARDVFGR